MKQKDKVTLQLYNLPTLNIQDLEKEILTLLAKTGNTYEFISKRTGISQRTLYRKFKKYNIVMIGTINKSIKTLEKVGYQITKIK